MKLIKDPRVMTLVAMLTLLSYGVWMYDFELSRYQVLLTFVAGIATQAFFLRYYQIQQRGYLSAIITCTGIALLLRSTALWAHPLIAVLAIASKFLIRMQGKHLFNPTNFGVAIAVLCLPGVWISPGQWGYGIAMGFWFLVLGSIVVFRCCNQLVTWSFIFFFAVFYAVHDLWWIGHPLRFLLYELENGSFLLFAFFMISDPRTTPDHPLGRVIYAGLVALFGMIWQYELLYRSGFIWGLFFLAPLVPVIDYLLPADRRDWNNLQIFSIRSIVRNVYAYSPKTAIST